MRQEVIQALKERRSIRKFKPDRVPKVLVNQIVDAGLYAANAMGQQKPIVVAVMNKEIRDQLSDVNRQIGGWQEGFDPFYGAPVVLVVLAPKEWANRVYDGSLMMGQLMLAAYAAGLGSCWIHRAKETFAREEGKALLKKLGIPDEFEGIGHCILGYPDQIVSAAPRKAERVYYLE